jgi:peptidyl-prolyl cis-trans isomerase C
VEIGLTSLRKTRFPVISTFRAPLLATLAAGALAGLASIAIAADDAVVAKVNGKSLTEADLKLAEEELGARLGDQIASLPETTRRRIFVEYLVESQLFADAAEGANMGTGPEFEGRLRYWRRRALRDTYVDKAVKGSISEAAAKTFYDDKVKGIPEEEEVQVRHILVESEDLAKELKKKLDGGADFAALAKEHSTDPGSKDNGGLYPHFAKGRMVPEFEAAAFALEKGKLSEPVKSQFGWHVIKLEDKRKKAPPSFEEVKDMILSGMIQNKEQSVGAELRKKAGVEYVDAEIKKQVEAQEKQAEAQQKLIEEQIKKLEAEQAGKEKNKEKK